MSDRDNTQALLLASRPCLAPKVRVQKDKVSGNPVLLYPEGVLLLNSTGAAIVALCDGQCAAAEIVKALAERYNASPDLLAQDVVEFLGRLQDRGLLELVTPEDPGP